MKQLVRGITGCTPVVALQITHQQPLSEALAETVQLFQEVCTFAVLQLIAAACPVMCLGQRCDGVLSFGHCCALINAALWLMLSSVLAGVPKSLHLPAHCRLQRIFMAWISRMVNLTNMSTTTC